MKKYLFICSMFVAFVFHGCVDYEMQSERTNSTITIDGSDEDWQGKLQYISDAKVAMGFLHDDDNLYVCITTNDKNIARKFLMPGMNIWFDTGDKDIYAVRFPVIDREKMRSEMSQGQRPTTQGERQEKGGEKSENRNEMFRDILENQTTFLLVNGDDYPLGTYPINGSSGIKIKPGMTKDKFVLELQYALSKFDGNVVNYLQMNENREIMVKFEAVEFEKTSGPGGFGGGMPMGGNRGGTPGGGDMAGGPGGGRPEGRPFGDNESADIDFSVNVKLVD